MSPRLSLLERAKYLRKHRVGVYSFYSGRPVNVVFTLAGKGLEVVRELYNYDLDFGVQALNTSTLCHDVELAWLLEHWKQRPHNHDAFSSRLFNWQAKRNEQIPDALTFDANGGLDCAIELELTRKSMKRIKDILFDYRCMNIFKNVHFVCRDKYIFGKYQDIVGELKARGLASGMVATPQFHVHDLSAFYSNKNAEKAEPSIRDSMVAV